MRGVILAAGQGVRLNGGQLESPKCLVHVGRETLLARNIRLLRDAGVDELVVVIGCGADLVRRSSPRAHLIENPLFASTNSLYSLWLARPWLVGGFVVMNCDVLVHPQLVTDLLSARHEDALLLAYADDGAVYGEEEMKVRVRRGRVVEISKEIDPDAADGENVGIAKFGVEGAGILLEEIEALVRAGDRRTWVPRAFQEFSRRRPLHAVGTRGLPWIEIDFPEDYERAVAVVLPQIDAGSGTDPRSDVRRQIARSA